MKQNSSIKEQSLNPQPNVRAVAPNEAGESLDDRVLAALHAASEKKALEPVILDLREIASFTDYFVIVSGANSRQVRTIAEAVEEELTRDAGPKPLRVEGLNDLTWVLIDYGDIVVHVFLDETRHYYELERLWSDVPRVAWADSLSVR